MAAGATVAQLAPPNANDIAAFPPLQQGSDGKFVMGRTISFAGAAAAG